MIGQLYYSSEINDEYIVLDRIESRHFSKVMRNLPESEVSITDGLGNIYRCKYYSNQSDNLVFKVKSQIKDYNKRDYYLHIAIVPTKNIKRMEWFIEKAVEIGIDEISFILGERSERKDIKLDRMQKISVSAIKQSKQAFLPTINKIKNFDLFISDAVETSKLIADTSQDLKNTSIHINSSQSTCVLIGPEGGFTKNEIRLAHNKSFQSISFGNSIMRTETAAIHVCSTIKNAN